MPWRNWLAAAQVIPFPWRCRRRARARVPSRGDARAWRVAANLLHAQVRDRGVGLELGLDRAHAINPRSPVRPVLCSILPVQKTCTGNGMYYWGGVPTGAGERSSRATAISRCSRER